MAPHRRAPDEKAKAADRESGSILVVSNRLPITFHRGARGLEGRRSAGGLVSALEPALKAGGGCWMGWAGMEIPQGKEVGAEDSYELRAVHLSDAEAKGYYHGFSNRTLWPLFHCFNDRTRFQRSDWNAYERVNQKFAEAAAEKAPQGGLVWIHDYHLMLMPRLLRNDRPDVRIAFFLHIPFPPFDLFRLLPWSRQILRGLLASDLIGFHIDLYTQNFLDCVSRSLTARVDRSQGLVEHGERTTQVGSFPIGIDFDFFESRAKQAPPASVEKEQQLILGVDRLDYTKGIPERIRAYERLLEKYPEHREKVMLLQLAVPSRSQVAEYRELKSEIDELVGRVGGRFATASWSPIRYLYQSLPPERLAALYRDADVAFITPGRDGMNLVAKEFVACQVRRPGVLVLSQLAGSADTMREALQINPYNLDGTADSLHRALTMDLAERQTRMNSLRRRERRKDVHAWVEQFLSAARTAQGRLRPPDPRDFEEWLADFLAGYRLALFVGYDGVLASAGLRRGAATLAQAMRDALAACAVRDDTEIAIVSGRPLGELQKLVRIPDVTFAGNRGLEISGPGISPFRHSMMDHFEEQTAALARNLRRRKVKDSWVEERGAALAFHFPDKDARDLQLRERITTLVTEAGFEATELESSLEARPQTSWDKGNAVLHVLRRRYGTAWSEHVRVVYIGFDLADERVFRMLSGLGVTFRVGRADTLTSASRRLPGIKSVQQLLSWLADRDAAGTSPSRHVSAE